MRPDKALKIGGAFLRWGASPALGVTTAAIHHPHELAIVDERGALSWERLHRRSNALAHSFAGMGIGPGDGVGIMCRNHRGFVEATLAAAKLGASALYLNTMFAGPQLAEVTRREGPKALVYDEEFGDLLAGVDDSVTRIVGWCDGEVSGPTLDSLIEAGDESDHKPPPEKPKFVILTSGTTGTPKGAQRSSPDGLMAIASLIDKIPFRSRDDDDDRGAALPLLGLLPLRDEPADRLDDGAAAPLRPGGDAEGGRAEPRRRPRRGAGDGPADPRPARRGRSTATACPSLKITSLSGSALPGELAIEWMDRFGDNVYNLYGSTEVAYATVATPEDLRAAPGTAGKPPRGTKICLYDEHGKEVPQGEVGRIFVGNEMAFEGYTGGGGKEIIDGLYSSGDVGHFDADGRLFIDGRDDEMIVSGGENVFPREVEDLLADHEAVEEVAVIGVEDERVRPAAEGLRRRPRRGRGRRRGPDRPRQGQPRVLQGAARGRVPRRAAAQRHGQGAEAGPSRSRQETSA